MRYLGSYPHLSPTGAEGATLVLSNIGAISSCSMSTHQLKGHVAPHYLCETEVCNEQLTAQLIEAS